MFFFLLICTLISAPEDYREKLKKLERDLKETRETLQKLRKKESNLLEEIKYLNKEEKILRSMIQILENREKELNRELRELDRGVKTAEKILDTSLVKMRRGLVALYKTRNPTFLEALINTGSLYSAFDKIKASERLLEREKKVYEKIIKAERKLKKFKEIRERDLMELSMIQEEIYRKKRNLERTEAAKKKRLKRIRREKKAKEKYIRELEASISKLEKLIKKLERKRRKPIKPVKLKGKTLLKPVEGRIVSAFGTVWHPKYKTRIRNNGIDIRARPHAPVRAVESGQVAYAGQFLGYGKTIIIDHGGFFSIYTGLGSIEVREGESVSKGEIIGRIATKDSPQGPVLHFELRLGGKAVDPMRYIKW